MTARQIIYSSTIIVLGFFQALPALLCLASTNIPVILLGIIWGVLLGKFWSSTIIVLPSINQNRINYEHI